jgi:hypothetical protein
MPKGDQAQAKIALFVSRGRGRDHARRGSSRARFTDAELEPDAGVGWVW